MNALIAPQYPTIPTTVSTATAAGATSAIPLRIDTFIKSKLEEAHSGNFSGLKSSAEAARSHGFTASANSRYVDFLEAMSAAPDQVSYYAEKYPACFFLPWKALNATLTALNLWCDLPKHYTGAIPAGQLPYLDIFSLDSNDTVTHVEMLQIINNGGLNVTFWRELLNQAANSTIRTSSPHDQDWLFRSSITREEIGAKELFKSIQSEKRKVLIEAVKDFQNSWFVIAPPDAFNVSEDWRSRTRKLLIESEPKKQPPPNDPLVVRFVHNGCLVVAAWGEEASELNSLVSNINI